MPLLGPYVLSVVMYTWDIVTHLYIVQCFGGGPCGPCVAEVYPVSGHVWPCMHGMF